MESRTDSGPRSPPPLDVLVFGATGFVGRILCAYLLEQYGTGGTLRWAAAGRSEQRLRELRDSLGADARTLPLEVADARDPESLRRLCAGTRVVVSTVGPYALYGDPLVEACAATGTDYCDLTGELQWIRRMLDRHEATARSSGARIVHCCGFDSIPSDLGVHYLQRAAVARFGEPCRRVKMRVRGARGGVSGGTVASLMNVLREVARDPSLRREMADPYSICPAAAGPRVRQPNVVAPAYDDDFAAWSAPFVMSAINTRVVHRSNALSGDRYGKGFTYDEAVLTGTGLRGRLAATAMTAGLGAIALGGALPPLRFVLERYVLPKPGEGPSPDAQRKGYWDLRFHGRTAGGQELRARVSGEGDPAYASTARMLGQAAACLALDADRRDSPGGFWTPATVLGDRLIERLSAHAGVTFTLEGDSP